MTTPDSTADQTHPSEVKERIRSILAQMADLEEQLEDQLHHRQDELLYKISNRKVRFEAEVRAAHERLRFGLTQWFRQSELRNVVSAPVVYSLIVPITLLDLWVTLYQALCFPLYRIARVDRSRFVVVDRHRLAYLNLVEKLNCAYCGYANGVIAYAREVASRTELYWCPIKHARRAAGSHARYARFLDYGDPTDFHATQASLRATLTCDDCPSKAGTEPPK
jgi:hypothetical protein